MYLMVSSNHMEQNQQGNQQQFEQVFQPYLHLRLGAFENLKIVVGLLASLDKSYSTYELELSSASDSKSRPSYIVDTELGVIDCGRTNGYEEAITLLDEDKTVDLSAAKTVNVPVLSLQQISFMCVETSHFDHC